MNATAGHDRRGGLGPAPGLVSVTFRALAPRAIVALVTRARLASIEWGGDVHVPPGELARAREVGQMTRDAGLTVSAYGSYYRGATGPDFERVLETAVALGAPLIRVWAGDKASAAAAPADWAGVIADTQRVAALAAAAGCEIAFEFHSGTLTDTAATCVRLLHAVQHPAVGTYWQPLVGADVAENTAGLTAMLPWLRRLHVFHWGSDWTRYPLAAGADRWLPYLRLARHVIPSIEFVRDDAPEAFLEDAQTLLRWCAADGQESAGAGGSGKPA